MCLSLMSSLLTSYTFPNLISLTSSVTIILNSVQVFFPEYRNALKVLYFCAYGFPLHTLDKEQLFCSSFKNS